MSELNQYSEESAAHIKRCFEEGVYRIVLSNPKNSDVSGKRIVMNRLSDSYQTERIKNDKIYHENLTLSDAEALVLSIFGTQFRQLNAWTKDREFDIRITKRGKVFSGERPKTLAAPEERTTHNRKKRRLIPEGLIIQPLIDMGVFSPEGAVISSMHGKYRQINRFLELIDDELDESITDGGLNIIDFGCGKSYLTFIVYYYLAFIRKLDVTMVGLDLKADVIENCNAAAARYGYDKLKFVQGDINGYHPDFDVDMVITLHACDTATDYALKNAIDWNAGLIMSVPCCQHELNEQIAADNLTLFTRHGLIKERFSALMTDAVRANLLTYSGYRVDILEFVDFSHTPKNLLIRARKAKVPSSVRMRAIDEVNAAITEFHVTPTLYRLIMKN